MNRVRGRPPGLPFYSQIKPYSRPVNNEGLQLGRPLQDATMIEDVTRPAIESTELCADGEPLDRDITVEKSGEQIALNLKDAAFALGKSMRALERSLSGKWGNKLPDGWTSRKVIVEDREEWQVLPPPGYNLDGLVEHKRSIDYTPVDANGTEQLIETRQLVSKATSKFNFGRPMIELHLLRELASTQKELNEERRAHLEDLRLLAEAQSSMRLLQDRASETAALKAELLAAQKDLISLKDQYQRVLNMPWWKRIFTSNP